MFIVMWGLWAPAQAGPEVCNGVDDDGDGRIDEGPVAWAGDSDGDGDGSASDVVLTESCGAVPAGGTASVGDCDDGDAGRSSGAGELCNGIDDDCDGQVDEGACGCDVVEDAGSAWQVCLTPSTWFDARARCAGDGYHLASIDSQTVQDAVFAAIVAHGIDFWMGMQDQATEGVYVWDDGTPVGYTNYRYGEPNDWYMTEDCTELEHATGLWDDQDCSYLEAFVCEVECTPTLWFADQDGDGLGDPAQPLWACGAPADHVANDADCDDVDPEMPAVWYADLDDDGWGEAVQGVGCSGDVLTAGDCDDRDPARNPGAVEVDGDGIDQDCDGADGARVDTGTPGSEPIDTGTFGGPGDTAVPEVDEPEADEPGSDEVPGIEPSGPSEPDFGFGLGCATSPGAPAGLFILIGALAARRRRGRVGTVAG